jgi:pyruvate formate lyase activating enzyme
VIPEINQEIKKISEFLTTLNNVVKYELLPYHPLGVAKQKAIGKTEITEFSVPTKEYMQEVERYAYIR